MKPLLLGMCNPLSDDPEFDLYPYPEGSAGWRLWKMMPEGMRRGQYLDMFERRNLLRERAWDQKRAREAAQVLLPELDGRVVVVLGTQVRAALGLPLTEPLRRVKCAYADSFVFEWIAFPHPSGRSRWFNQPENMARARDVLQSLVLP